MATLPFREGPFDLDDEAVAFFADAVDALPALRDERVADPLAALLAVLLAVMDVGLPVASAPRSAPPSPPVVERAAVRAAVRMATSPATPAREPLEVLAVAVRPSPLEVLDPFRRLGDLPFEFRVLVFLLVLLLVRLLLVFLLATEVSSTSQGLARASVRVSPRPRNHRP